MEEGNSLVRRWKDLNNDMLVKIIQSFDLFPFISFVPQVFLAWQSSYSDQRLWKRLDLSVMQSNFIRVSIPPYIYVDTPSREKLICILKIFLNLSHGNILTLIFHYNLYVYNNQLTYTAKRCPRLKRLVMPVWEKLEKQTMCSAFHEWCTELSKPALVILLDGLKKLKVLNISHCIITEYLPPPAPMKIFTELDQSILKKASRLDKFLTCMSDSCIMCQLTRNDEGFMRLYKYADLWKVDEVKSLAI
ncbi:hypothetical protein MTR67_001539 [Solanum verrucosum]|uniref:F-box/LRR-repeat protein n=1 Tax=Solanum verrucosum TaxID=315347 RepID=A0AAF0T7Y7_SOLVR|nr:hypothetical protein MTR67_001539 [Solanum verrucosum]